MLSYKRSFLMAIIILIMAMVGPLCTLGHCKVDKKVRITVYNDNRALISEYRKISLKKGINEVRVTDVPAKIDPTSVHFISVTDPTNTLVLEQNFEYDLVSTDKLLSKYIGQKIQVITKKGNSHQGILLGVSGGLILKNEDNGITVINKQNVGETIFPSLPQGLIARPALMWQIYTKKRGNHDIEIAYITKGVTWHADYVLALSKGDSLGDLNGWITVDNRAGSTFSHAHMKLVAGTLHKAAPMMEDKILYKAAAKARPREVKERALFEYHLYDVSRPITLKNNQTKQIEFITRSKIPIEKRFVLDSKNFYFAQSSQKQPIEVQLQFKNETSSGLGIPLPAGKVRIYKEDVDGSLQLIGEDNIGHTPKDETISLIAGKAFDLLGKRIKVDHKTLGKRSRSETWEILLYNHKDEKVRVHVIERMPSWGEWEIIKETNKHKKLDSSSIEYEIQVPANGTVSITYTVIYKW